MRAYLQRHPVLRRWPVMAAGVTVGIVLGFMTFGTQGIEARGTAAEAAAAQAACGDEGQRACCFLEGNACLDGLIQIAGCVGNCACGAFQSLGLCVKPSPCGGEGQRTCKSGLVESCNTGLIAVPGCSGDCYAGDSNLFTGQPNLSTRTCTAVPLAPIAEPSTNADPEPHTCSMAGYADLHLHLFADLAHGGGVLAGRPYDPELGVNAALRPDFTTPMALEKKDGTGLVPPPMLPFCPAALFGGDCLDTFFHGDHDILAGDSLGAGTKDGAGSNFGAPVFSGWPKWTSTTHQQVYYKWLERAWQGGLRIVTMLAVTNEALCRGSRRMPGVNCEDSMAPIYQQIQAAKDFEAWIAEHHGGWFTIVYTPLEARRAIARGKLAVVLGVETAELFNCKFPMSQCTTSGRQSIWSGLVMDNGFLESCTFDAGTNDRPLGTDSSAVAECTPESIDEKVEELYQAGVRHVFPVHNFDNAFGGAATWNSTIEIGNRVVEGHWWKTRECKPEGYTFKLGGLFDTFTQAMIGMIGFGSLLALPAKPEDASCNAFGLLPLGQTLIQSLMKRGMIIDVDHLSSRAFNDTMDMMEDPGVWVPGRTGKYPVVATHVLLRESHLPIDTLHERMRTVSQLERIRDGGGMIAAMLKDDVQDTDLKGVRRTWQLTNFDWVRPGSEFVDDCVHSSKSFATAYANLSWIMGRPVAFGSDFNGTAGHFGPRFGSEGCGGVPPPLLDPLTQQPNIEAAFRLGERSQQYYNLHQGTEGSVQYPFTVPGFGTFQRQRTGSKVFDYNVDGLAHIGLLPDFVHDLQAIGFAQKEGPPGQGTYLDMIFNSADEYVRVWEKARGDTPPADICALVADNEPPTVTPTVSPAPNAAGWHRTNPIVSWTVTDDSAIATTTGCGTVTVTAETGGTTFTCTATDVAGNSAQASVTIKLDKTPPVIEGTRAPLANAYGWNNTDVEVAFSCSDALSGVDDCTPPLLVGDEAAGQARTGQVTDRAGNTAAVTVANINIDKTPPTILASADRDPNAHGWYNADVTVTYVCADTLSGVLSCAPPETLALEGASLSATGLVMDLAGNTAHVTLSGINIDMTPPVVTCSNDSPSLWPPNGRLVTVRTAVDVDGGISGAAGFTLVAAASSEADNGLGDGNTTNDMQGWLLGTADTEGQVRAERSGGGAGRIYSLVYEGTDLAGNAAVCTTTVLVPVLVPHD